MRVLLVSTLAATLAGCSCFAPVDPTAVQTDLKPIAFKAETQEVEPTIGSDRKPSSVQSRKKAGFATKKIRPATAQQTEIPPPPPNDQSDPVVAKAKASIAGALAHPEAAEFTEIRQTVKNLLGELVDAVCGYVNAENRSGADGGRIPFVYIIQHDEGYLADGSSLMAETAYRNVCE